MSMSIEIKKINIFKKYFKIIFALCLCLALFCPECPEHPKILGILDASAAYSANDSQNIADQIGLLVNQERETAGLAPVRISPLLTQLAQQRAEELVVLFSHVRPDGSDCNTILDGVVDYMAFGENVAYGYTEAQGVMAQWMNSLGHRANILNSRYEYLGVGRYESGGVTYWVQIFTGGSALEDAYLPEIQEDPAILGDVNQDGVVNAGDASLILSASALTGSGAESGLTPEQEKIADINTDSQINAEDASLILEYSAVSGAGFTGTLEEYLNIKFILIN